MSNLYAVHRDERVWEDPDLFNPGRFLDDSGKIVRKEQFIPFAIGNCKSSSIILLKSISENYNKNK